jgi:hypothetical protein
LKRSSSTLDRLVTAIAGLLVGGLLGMLVLYFLMVLVGSDFGLDNVRLGAAFGGAIGFFLGWWFPYHWSLLDFIN